MASPLTRGVPAQNQGNTPLHFAIAYGFFDLGSWLTDKDKGASANDQLHNKFGLGPYDGIAP